MPCWIPSKQLNPIKLFKLSCSNNLPRLSAASPPGLLGCRLPPFSAFCRESVWWNRLDTGPKVRTECLPSFLTWASHLTSQRFSFFLFKVSYRLHRVWYKRRKEPIRKSSINWTIQHNASLPPQRLICLQMEPQCHVHQHFFLSNSKTRAN